MPDHNRNPNPVATKAGFFRRTSTYVVGVPVLLALLLVGGPFVYINFVEGDAPAKLSFSADSTSSTRAGTSGTSVPATVDGTWTIGQGSKAGYRVKEVLFGQSAEGVGRTSAVTGDFTISGTTVSGATFTVDLTKVTSDQDNRDRQFQGRIMETATYPTATFKLTKPITLSTLPANLDEVTVSATGDLMLHGKTQSVTFDLKARRNGTTIEINGTIPVAFADYGVANPSFGPASVGDTGEVEVLLVLTQKT